MQRRIVARIAIAVGVLIISVIVWNTTKREQPRVVSRVDLDRPLIVGVVSWPGYAGGITANLGFQENAESIFTKKYGLPVRFVLIEDIDARGKAFAKGGPDGVDVVWTTVDFWANEVPNFIAGGIDAAAFLHVDWSRGGDALVADRSLQRVEDLRGKRIALVQYTPSHWLLETALRRSRLSDTERATLRASFVFTQDVAAARTTFVAGQVDAAVLWEPDVSQALKRSNAHILASTRDYPDLIADVMVAKKDFLAQYPRAIDAFVRGWLDGVAEAKRNPDLAARVLVENEPLFADLGIAATRESLAWVEWPDLAENQRMFGVGGQPVLFDALFRESSVVWKDLGVITEVVDPAAVRDASFVEAVTETP